MKLQDSGLFFSLKNHRFIIYPLENVIFKAFSQERQIQEVMKRLTLTVLPSA
jgi:hypothetical protein